MSPLYLAGLAGVTLLVLCGLTLLIEKGMAWWYDRYQLEDRT